MHLFTEVVVQNFCVYAEPSKEFLHAVRMICTAYKKSWPATPRDDTSYPESFSKFMAESLETVK